MPDACGLTPWQRSVSGFFLVPKRQDVDDVLTWIVAIQCNVSGLSETDDQFPEFRLVRQRPPDFRSHFQLT